LRRALFDPATFGRVRFHHRSVQEYLAASRLRKLLGEGMSLGALFRLLFTERHGEKVVVPSMRPVVAWLAHWNDAVRKELINREPETLLSYADPRSLAVVDRERTLRAFAALYGKGGRRIVGVPMEQVRRIADGRLAPAVRELWSAAHENPDVRELLLELILCDASGSCVDIAVDVAWDQRQEQRHRILAAHAVLLDPGVTAHAS
jgi:hypothetical protein